MYLASYSTMVVYSVKSVQYGNRELKFPDHIEWLVNEDMFCQRYNTLTLCISVFHLGICLRA